MRALLSAEAAAEARRRGHHAAAGMLLKGIQGGGVTYGGESYTQTTPNNWFTSVHHRETPDAQAAYGKFGFVNATADELKLKPIP